MRRITREELERSDLDRAALATAGIDSFCSATDWILAAHEAWEPHLEPWLIEGEAGYLLFVKERAGLLRLLTPFDRMWGYSCPVVGPDPAALARRLLADADWDLAILSGVDERSALWDALVETLLPRAELGRGDEQRRWQADLADGFESYVARRPPRLQRALRRLERQADVHGVVVEPATGGAEALYARILEIERRSWKGPQGTGLMHDEMRAFYRVLVRRLHARHALRLRFARIGGEDVGYILGGVLGDQYRGLQFSFDDRFRALGLGNLLQVAELRALCAEGYRTYDLGIDLPYKRRWADTLVETSTLIVRPRRRTGTA